MAIEGTGGVDGTRSSVGGGEREERAGHATGGVVVDGAGSGAFELEDYGVGWEGLEGGVVLLERLCERVGLI